jgi:hypothetical protein
MAVILPDVIGEYVDGPERYATGGLQYAAYFDPGVIAPEQVSHLFLFLQNTLAAPVAVNIKVILPSSGGLFKASQPLLKVQTPLIQLKLAKAEAGMFTLPVTTTEHIEPGQHHLGLEVKVASQGRADRIRPSQSQSKMGQGFVDSLVGLNLVGTVGATYSEKSAKKADIPLTVAGKPIAPERAPRLQPQYQTIWLENRMELFNQAIHELNLREVKFKQELTVEALYATLYTESTGRFADAGLPLRIGEAIILGKILTYCCQYFLASSDRRNGLLVPIWERALEAKADTTDVLHVLRTVGYPHLLKLATAISFGVVAKAVGQQVWPLVERQAVINHVAECLEAGQNLDIDFLYLPLLMAGVIIAGKLKLEGENNAESMALLKKAYEARVDLFTDAEMAQANKVFSHLLTRAL